MQRSDVTTPTGGSQVQFTNEEVTAALRALQQSYVAAQAETRQVYKVEIIIGQALLLASQAEDKSIVMVRCARCGNVFVPTPCVECGGNFAHCPAKNCREIVELFPPRAVPHEPAVAEVV